VHRTYELGGNPVGIRTTSAAFGRWVDRCLAPYRVEGETPPEYSLVVDGGRGDGRHQGRRFHILYRGVTPLVRTLVLATLGRALLLELESALAAHRDDAVFVRSALVWVRGRRALVPWWVVPYVGELGRRVERVGMTLPAVTWVSIDPGSDRVSLARPKLRVPRSALRRLSDVAERVGTMANGHRDRVFLDEPAAVDEVWAFWEDPEVQGAPTRGLALHQMTASVLNLPKVGGAALEALGRVVERADCYAVPPVSAQGLLEVLAAPAGPLGGSS
jgi:hypothetical protein